VVNNVVVNNTMHINAVSLTYNNLHVDNAIISATHENFSNGHVNDVHGHVTNIQDLENVRGMLPVKPVSSSLVAGGVTGVRPPENILSRQVMGTRAPQELKLPWLAKTPKSEIRSAPNQDIVTIHQRPSKNMSRPEFGIQTGEERLAPPLPPRFKERRGVTTSEPSREVLTIRSENNQGIPGFSRPTGSTNAQQHNVPEPLPPREGKERRNLPPELRKSETVSAYPHTPSAVTQQRAHGELPGRPANRVYLHKKIEPEKLHTQHQKAD
jgi:hypothetical protein